MALTYCSPFKLIFAISGKEIRVKQHTHCVRSSINMTNYYNFCQAAAAASRKLLKRTKDEKKNQNKLFNNFLLKTYQTTGCEPETLETVQVIQVLPCDVHPQVIALEDQRFGRHNA